VALHQTISDTSSSEPGLKPFLFKGFEHSDGFFVDDASIHALETPLPLIVNLRKLKENILFFMIQTKNKPPLVFFHTTTAPKMLAMSYSVPAPAVLSLSLNIDHTAITPKLEKT